MSVDITPFSVILPANTYSGGIIVFRISPLIFIRAVCMPISYALSLTELNFDKAKSCTDWKSSSYNSLTNSIYNPLLILV